MARNPSKTIIERQNRLGRIMAILKRAYPAARCSLDYSNPLQLLVATVLSAQCTDERVNIVTRDLFGKYRSAEDLARVSQAQLERDIQSTGFYRNKAKALRGIGAELVARHDGKVPDSMEALIELPGIGRKTANVVLGNAFNKSEGVVVDTHVGRVSLRLGLTKHTDAVKAEQDLMQIVPREDWTLFSHLLIYHGRQICQSRKPRCRQCPLLALCPAGPKLIKSGKAAE
jgi:endonuclease III